YPGTTYLYICSRTLKSPGAAPTIILKQTGDCFNNSIRKVTFDSTGNIAIVQTGSVYYYEDDKVSIYNANNGSLVMALDAPGAVTIVDKAGALVTINIYSPGIMGTQIVLKATSSGASVVSRNDHYIPKDVLDALPTTVSNKDIRIYTTGSKPYESLLSGDYHFFKKDGTYLVSITNYSNNRYGNIMSSIGSPDVSADGKYAAVAYDTSYRSTASCQSLTIFDMSTGIYVKNIDLLSPYDDKVQSIRFAEGSSDLVEVTYAKAGLTTYSITTGKPQNNDDIQLNEVIQRLDALSAKNQPLPENIAIDPNMAGNKSITAEMITK
ncbi:MAG: hypothetical protein V1682_04820, partial [Candidatus Omnitrophota bacterium]